MTIPGPEPQRISGELAASYLSDTYGWPPDRSERVLVIATWLQPSVNAEPTEHGFVKVVRDGDSYIITDCGGRYRK
jgi:hypothetical protein